MLRIVLINLLMLSCSPAFAQWTAHEVDLPSAAAGGGTLALTVYEPAASRYADGAPVVVHVPGGTSWGGLANPAHRADGVVLITFLLPGGHDAVRSSDGVWDNRGLDSIAAVRDVVLYAGGLLADDDGLLLEHRLAVDPLSDQVGLVGSSNGGNLAVVVPSVHGAELDETLRWIVQWESPVSSQAAVCDNSKVALIDCPQGVSGWVGDINPRYLSYGPLELTIDFSDLAVDGSNGDLHVLHDGNGDGEYTTVPDPMTGCRTPDLDLDGELELDEDYPLTTYPSGDRRVYSRTVTRALDDSGLLSGGWPSGVLDLQEAESYWNLREAVRHYAGAVDAIPALEGMVLVSVVDHVQGDPDRFHIRQAFEGWHGTGAWVRLNTAPRYVLEVEPSLTDPLPNTAPNRPPLDWSSPFYTYPETVPTSILTAAAIFEMADRAREVVFRDGFESQSTGRWSFAQ